MGWMDEITLDAWDMYDEEPDEDGFDEHEREKIVEMYLQLKDESLKKLMRDKVIRSQASEWELGFARSIGGPYWRKKDLSTKQRRKVAEVVADTMGNSSDVHIKLMQKYAC